MPRRKMDALGRGMESAAVFTGKELGAIVAQLEKRARELAKKREALQGRARKQSAQWARRASRALEKLAKDLEKARARPHSR